MQDPNRSYTFPNVGLAYTTASTQLLCRTPNLLAPPATMEIGGLLNARHAANADAQLRHHLQHSMQMDHNSYTMGQSQAPTMNHQQHQHQQHHLASSNGMAYPSMQQSQSPSDMYPNSYDSRSETQEQTGDDDFGAPRPKAEGSSSQKQFHCSTCAKPFARRSDLARHGMYN